MAETRVATQASAAIDRSAVRTVGGGLAGGLLLLSLNVSGLPALSYGALGLAVLIGFVALAARFRIERLALVAVPLVGYWLLMGLLANTTPLAGRPLPEWFGTDARLLIALLPLFVLGATGASQVDVHTFVRLLRVSVWLNLMLFAAGSVGVLSAVLMRVGNYVGLTSSHHATGFLAGGALLVFFFRSPGRRWRDDGPTIMAAFVLLIGSGSRTTMLGLLLAFAWYAISSGRVSLLLRTAAGVGSVVVLAALVNARLAGTLTQLVNGSFQQSALNAFVRGFGRTELSEYVATDGLLPGFLANILSRFYIWGNGLGIWRQSPITGVGSGRVNDANLSYSGADGLLAIATNGTVVSGEATGVHNQYLQTLAENGLVGLFLLGVLWFGLYRHICRADRMPNGFMLSAKLMIPFALGTAMTGNTLESPALTLIVLTWVGLVAIAGDEEPPAADRMKRSREEG